MEMVLLTLCIIILIGIIIICVVLIKWDILIKKIFEETLKNKSDIANLKDFIERKLDRNYNVSENSRQTINDIIDKYMSKFTAKQDFIFTKIINIERYLIEYFNDLKAHRQRKRQKINNSSTDK